MPEPQTCIFIKREALVRLFSREFCEIFKNTFIYRTHPDDCFWRYEFFLRFFPYGISPGDCFEHISSRKALQKAFKKIPQKTPLKLEESLFLMMLQTLYLKFYKYAILTSMFSYKFWEFFRTKFPLKTLGDYLWMRSIYSVKMHLKNMSKTLPKICD